MKYYKVRFDVNGSLVHVFFKGVSYCERIVDCKFCSPFTVVEFFKDGELISQFYPDKYFSFAIEETDF